jgi:hypothetical protein
MSLSIAELWRYPVKSLAGERLSVATLDPDGMRGDRLVRVRGPEGVRTSRRQHQLLGLRGTLGDDGQPCINGHPWNSAAALALVKGAAGPDAWLEEHRALDRFDILPLLVATDGAVAAFGRDVRRLRPNIVIAGVLRDIVRRFDNQLALNAEVIRGGTLRTGDPVVLRREVRLTSIASRSAS